MPNIHLAVDIGASSGRHIAGWLEDGRLVTREVYRFDTTQIRKNGHDCWDTERLTREVVAGLKAAKDAGLAPSTVAIDTWGVDFVLIDADGAECCDAVAYRDRRTDRAEQLTDPHFTRAELYGRTGIQFQKFNTIYQLVVLKNTETQSLERAERMLMIPEYLAWRLTGVARSEYTNASTTGLLNASARTWDMDIIHALDLPEQIFSELHEPGTAVGNLAPEVAAEVGFDCTVLLAPSHDTAAAYLAAPISDEHSAIISSGTWSLLGMELPTPTISEASRAANFTNEGGVGGTYRFLKNIMGLWIIQSIRREMNGEQYVSDGMAELTRRRKFSFAELEEMARASTYDHTYDVDDDSLLSPESMTDAVTALLINSGAPAPEGIGDVLRSTYLSLAACYAKAIANLGAITGIEVKRLNIVGGGSRDGFLNELTAEAAKIPVLAGPSEATSIGNLVSQIIASGEVESIPAARGIIKNSFEIKEY